ncbi:MAG: GGDEF domain-containing protein [Henriciella sp.]|uniref:GGDEF domain-containing protein n=1 Tax=Henriciella sp. TaxID=1968823 RepID=UPI003C74E844
MMDRNSDLLSPGKGATYRAFGFFAFVVAAALSLAVIFALLIVNFVGVPSEFSEFLLTTLLIAGCVAGPMGAIAAQNQYQMERYQAMLEAMAATDPLTGLFNRRSFERHAHDEVQRMKRINYPACIAIFDLDHFKSVNDKLGHAFGDQVLIEVAAVTKKQLRGSFDRAARWGGEEFALLLSNVTEDDCRQACDRLRTAIERRVISHKGKTARVTASFGVAPLTTEGGLEASLEEADAMLYEAKKSGRNRVCVAKPRRDAA